MSSTRHSSRIDSPDIALARAAHMMDQLSTHSKAMSAEDDGEDEGTEPVFSISAYVPVLAFASDLLVNVNEGVKENARLFQHSVNDISLPVESNARGSAGQHASQCGASLSSL